MKCVNVENKIKMKKIYNTVFELTFEYKEKSSVAPQSYNTKLDDETLLKSLTVIRVLSLCILILIVCVSIFVHKQHYESILDFDRLCVCQQ